MDKLREGFLLQDEGVEVLGETSHLETTYQHTLFAESQQEQRDLSSNKLGRTLSDHLHKSDQDAEQPDEADSGDLKHTKKSKRQLQREIDAVREARNTQKKHRKEQHAQRIKLEALKVREKDLRDAERELELQRAKMSSSIGGINKHGTKWRVRQRKK